MQREPAAEGEDRDLAERGHGLERRVVATGAAHDPQPGGEQPAGAGLQPGQLALLLPEPLDDPHPGDGGLHRGGDLGGLLLGVPVGGEQVAAAAQRDHPQQRPHNERDQRQQRGQPGHEDQRDQEHQGVAGHVRQELQQGLDEGDVGDRAADDLAGAQGVLLGAAEPQQCREGVRPQVVLHAERQPPGAVAADEARGEADGAESGEHQGPRGERAGAAGRDAVHDVPQDERQGGGGDGRGDRGAEGRHQVPAVAQAVGAEPAHPAGGYGRGRGVGCGVGRGAGRGARSGYGVRYGVGRGVRSGYGYGLRYGYGPGCVPGRGSVRQGSGRGGGRGVRTGRAVKRWSAFGPGRVLRTAGHRASARAMPRCPAVASAVSKRRLAGRGRP